MNAITIAGVAAVVVALLMATAVRLARRPGRIESVEDAAAAAETAIPGFAVAGAAVGADAGGALAVSTGNRVAAIRRVGRRYRVAEVAWTAVRSTPEGIVVETGDRRVGTVRLTRVDALDIRRLTLHETGVDRAARP